MSRPMPAPRPSPMRITGCFRASTLGALFLGCFGVAQGAPSGTLISDPQSLQGARSAARAGSSVASQLYNDSLFQNPASAAFQARYSLHLGYLGAGDALAASIIDTKSGPVGGGVYYVRRKTTGERIQENAGFSVMHRPADRLALGTTVRYVYEKGQARDARWNFDAGLRFLISQNFSLGLLGQNFLSEKSDPESRHYTAGLEYLVTPQLAFSFQGRQLNLKNEPSSVVTSFVQYSAGTEFRFTNGLTLRAGFEDRSSVKEQWASGGLGYEQAEFGLDYALSSLVKAKSADLQHTLGLSAFF